MIALLPLYLLGNLHCIGMCGPLMMFIAKHRYRWFYFLGRLTSFSFVGLLSGEMGFLVTAALKKVHLPALFSLGVGLVIITFGITSLLHLAYPGQKLLNRVGGNLSIALSRNLSKESPWPIFIFGLATILLPCGQTVVVYSAIALMQSAWLGLLNGFLFALLTSPSLIAAMQASAFLQKWRKHYRTWMGIAMLIVGTIALLRGLAELGVIPHLSKSHLVIY